MQPIQYYCPVLLLRLVQELVSLGPPILRQGSDHAGIQDSNGHGVSFTPGNQPRYVAILALCSHVNNTEHVRSRLASHVCGDGQ